MDRRANMYCIACKYIFWGNKNYVKERIGTVNLLGRKMNIFQTSFSQNPLQSIDILRIAILWNFSVIPFSHFLLSWYLFQQRQETVLFNVYSVYHSHYRYSKIGAEMKLVQTYYRVFLQGIKSWFYFMYLSWI